MKKLRIVLYLLVFLGLLLSFLFMKPLFVIMFGVFFIIVFYIIYKKLGPRTVTKTIRHGLLKGSLTNKYGVEEGGRIYKQLVEALQKRGYK